MDTVSFRSTYVPRPIGKPNALANACQYFRSWWYRATTYQRGGLVHRLSDVATLEGEGPGMSGGNSDYVGVVRGIPQPVKSGHQGSVSERRQASGTSDGAGNEGVLQGVGRRYDDLHAEMKRKVANATDCLEGIIKSMVG